MACGPTIVAPKAPDGSQVEIVVYFDRGLAGKTEDQQTQLNQLSDWMENNLVEMYTDVGYAVQKITALEQYTPGPGRYLLTVATVNYNPGSKAARMLVGFGAGSAALDTHYEFKGENGKSMIAKDHGRPSGRDWKHIAKALNQDMLMEITRLLGGVVE